MQSIKKDKKLSKKTMIAASIIAITLIGGTAAFAFYETSNNQDNAPASQADNMQRDNSVEDRDNGETVNYDESTDEERATGNDVKRDTIENREASDPVAGTPEDRKTIGIEATSVSQDGKTLRVRTIVQAIEQDGTCIATLSKAGQQNIRKSANTQPLSSYSTCKGFDFDMTGKPAGQWQLRLDYTSSRSTGTYSEGVDVQ